MADFDELEDQLNDDEVGPAQKGPMDALLEDVDEDDDFHPAQQQEEHDDDDDEDAFAAPAPAKPAAAAADAAPLSAQDRKAKMLALAEQKRKEEADGGKKSKKDKGDKGDKKRKRDKEGKEGKKDKGSRGDKGDKAGKKKLRPQRTPGGEGGDAAAARPPRAAGAGDESEDSREFKEQDADREFIDDDGEVGGPEEEELGSDVVRDEEDEGAEAARLAAAPEAMEGEEDEAMDAEQDLFGRKKKKKMQSEQQVMEELNDRVAKMEAAAEADMEAHLNKKPALNKLKMLREVEELLAQRKYHELFLHAGGLGTLKAWLEPYSDGTLPNVKIRTAVLSFCKTLPIDTMRDDVRENLKKSQLGSRVMFLAKCPDETQANRKLALDLVQKWARPIFFDPEAEAEKKRAKEESLKVARALALETQKQRDLEEEEERAARNRVKAGERGYRWHAVIPQTLKLDYVVAPQADPSAGLGGGDGMGMGMMGMGGEGGGSQAGAGGKRDEGRFAKKMREVQRKQKGSTARAAMPSVEGRNIIM